MELQPFVSVIVPVYNASQHLDRCLDAIRESSYSDYEVIVVDDGSTDASLEIAHSFGAEVLQLQRQSGPAAARNYGAETAKGEVLLFIDSDVLVRQETIARVANAFVENPGIAALFGSYDDDPAEKNFLSQYKNLVHHFVHQQSSSEAATFWAGCGAIRKEAFNAVGGFDQKRYYRPCIEDIELGYRLRQAGYRIFLDKYLQVKHLKEWRLKTLLHADILSRAVPWTRLILESQEMVNDLNLKISQKISSAFVGTIVMIAPFCFLEPRLLYLISILLAGVFVINLKLFSFFLKKRGTRFVLFAFPMQLLYYFYSGITFSFLWARYQLRE